LRFLPIILPQNRAKGKPPLTLVRRNGIMVFMVKGGIHMQKSIGKSKGMALLTKAAAISLMKRFRRKEKV
jgi:hypothetical protein